MEKINEPPENNGGLDYCPIPTIAKFHSCDADIRAIVGPVGSAKTTGAIWEVFYFLPWFLFKEFGIIKTKWVIVRNTYSELIDTTQATAFDWFEWGDYKVQQKNYSISYPDGPELEVLFRSCDNPKDVKKFKSLEVTGYLIDESIEVSGDIKRMLKNRIGRYPKFSVWEKALKTKFQEVRKLSSKELKQWMVDNHVPTRFGIETTNPPDVEHETYSQFAWDTPPPGPVPEKEPLKNHVGFWQPPHENDANLRPGYYDTLREDYKDNPDWLEMYILGKPGVIVKGKLVYNNFVRSSHVAVEPLIWAKGKLYLGWDNSGNVPACIVLQRPRYRHVQVLREYNHDKKNIIDFTDWVMTDVEKRFPGAEIEHWADPAGSNEYSKKGGGFTSNALLMKDECGVEVKPSDQNPTARYNAVDKYLGLDDGFLLDPSCTRLINGFMGGYSCPEIGTTGEYADKPAKNRFSHPQDALQYVLVKLALEDHLSLFDSLDLSACAA